MSDATMNDITFTPDLHNYLQEKQINAVFVSIVEDILRNRPENPIGFMVNYLLEKHPVETKGFGRIPLQGRGKATSFVSSKTSSTEAISETDSECSSVDTAESDAAGLLVDDLSTSEESPVQKRRRESVCAEKLTEIAIAESELKVIEKSEIEAARILHILQNNVFFSHLDEHQMKTVQDAMFCVERSDGDVIINQGDDGDNFYCIDNGIVEIFIDSPRTDMRNLVRSCGNGDAFGELAIMHNAPRAASCIAKGNVRLWALDRVSFNVILMKTTIAKRKSMVDILLNIPVFCLLTEFELQTIADTLQEEVFEDGSVICHQGEEGDKFYLVHRGTAICTKELENGSSVEVARLSSGAYFGEIALLTKQPRQATVTADGSLRCFSIDRRTFNRVMGPLRDMLMRSMDEYTTP
jgi:cAMP-dependent protein kinase regulator